ncbi:PREDICTED: uncharacterized protein LOC107349890 [Acropora digitifera]|uniref:uncharacterized protein LOC107349890 n=1 Tax=Acropora digitifera TaxID=70779 RepID=UPI00077AD5A0|nr:PREDICTED: uncharacterized protein LOC107349890 [Acropora digitifera]
MCKLRHQPLTLEIGPFCKVMASSKSFFDDVKKELECSVCQEQFSDVREPKILKCLHTFCKTCLTAWLSQQQCEGELSCPTCRQITQCSANDIDKLPSNLFCKQLVEIVEAYSGRLGDEDSPHCGICDEKKALKFYCVQCNAFLCEECAGVHEKGKVFKGQNIKEISNFNSNDVQKYVRRANVCKKHEDEVRYYCEKCNICICRDCALLEHREHNIISLDRGIDLKKSDITKRIQEVEDVGRRLQEQKQNLEKQKTRFDTNVDQSTLEIHRVVEHRINIIRKHEEAMTKELLKRKESFENEFSAKITDVNEKLMDIKSSLEFGRDILERNNLPEILNVEETLGRRFEDFSSSAGFSDPIELNTPAVKYVAADMFLSESELGKLIDAEISIGQDKAMIESHTRDLSRRGEPYDETDEEAGQLGNSIAQFAQTDKPIIVARKLNTQACSRSHGTSYRKAPKRTGKRLGSSPKIFTDERRDGNVECAEFLPKHWTPQPKDQNGFERKVHLYELNPAKDSQEYQKVQDAFKLSCPNNIIVKIERVQNPALYATYAIQKKKMDEGNGSKEMSLFHGTTGESCMMINHTGFNMCFHGKNGTVFGNGVDFALQASYSARYSLRNAFGYRYMYLTRVLVGEYTQGRQGLITPPPKDPNDPTDLYDSVVDNVRNPQIFVVFYDCQCYPEYLITFQ